jgi:hypothetical protein
VAVVLALLVFGVFAVEGQEMSESERHLAVPSLRVLVVGGFEGALGDNVEAHLEGLPLPEFAAVDSPILIDGSDLARLSAGQEFTFHAAFHAGIPVMLLHPTAAQLSLLAPLVGAGVFSAAAEELELDRALHPLDAIGLHNAAGSLEVAWFYARPEGTRSQEDYRLRQLVDWLISRTAARGRTAPAAAAVAGGGPIDVRDRVPPFRRTLQFTQKQATQQIHLDVWGVRELEGPDTHYLVEILTTWSAGNYSSGGNCCDDDGCWCQRKDYLRDFEVSLKPFPVNPGVTLLQYSPDTDRTSESYTVDSGWSIGGKVSAGSKGVGTEFTAGLRGGTKRTIKIKDATVLSLAGRDTPAHAGWRFEMPHVRGVSLTRGGKQASCQRLLDDPTPIQRASHQTRQFIHYQGPHHTVADGLQVMVDLTVDEETATMETDGGVNTYCNFFGCNCDPHYSSYQYGTGWVVQFPAVPLPAPPERPRLDDLQPERGRPGEVVTLHGEALEGVEQVYFGGVQAPTVVPLSNTEIQVLVPPQADPSAPPQVNVTVLTAGGLSNTVEFTYE